MRSSPTGNATLLRIQQEITEVAQRENELRTNLHNGTNGFSTSEDDTPSRVLEKASSTTSLNQSTAPAVNGSAARKFIPNNTTKGVMQKFFKLRGKMSAVSAISSNDNIQPIPKMAWESPEVTSSPPAKALIPSDKPLRKGYVPIQERIQSELRELKTREEELRVERRKSQPDLMASLEAENEEEDDISRSPSPQMIGKLRSAQSMTYLLDDTMPFETNSAPPSLRPARSLAQLCDALDDEIESPRSLIQQWESRIQQSQEVSQL